MSDIQIFIQDKDNEGEWRDIDEGLLDLSSHDAKVRADGYNKAIDDFVNACKENSICKTFGLREYDIVKIAEQLKEGGKYEM